MVWECFFKKILLRLWQGVQRNSGRILLVWFPHQARSYSGAELSPSNYTFLLLCAGPAPTEPGLRWKWMRLTHRRYSSHEVGKNPARFPPSDGLGCWGPEEGIRMLWDGSEARPIFPLYASISLSVKQSIHGTYLRELLWGHNLYTVLSIWHKVNPQKVLTFVFCTSWKRGWTL